MTKSDFDDKLKSFISSLKKARIDGYYNPWAEDGDVKDSASKRCKNLKLFLQERQNAKYVLIGEAPSYGARYTGIPMTSEEVLKKYHNIFDSKKYSCTSKNSSQSPIKENTATAVWNIISQQDKDFVIWNAFAFLNNDKSYVKNPSHDLIEASSKITIAFIDMFEKSEIITVGQKAQIAISYCFAEHVRHPSCGGIDEFKKRFKEIISKNKQ